MNPFRFLYGRTLLQRPLRYIHRHVLQAMNYGPDARIDNSGELAVLRLIRDHIEQSKPSHYRTLVVDVGAHIGMYSRAVVDIFRFGTVVIALEPSSTAYDKLVQNVPESVVTHRVALGAQAGTMPLYEEKAGESAFTSI